mgnify:CR=1 FL=1
MASLIKCQSHTPPVLETTLKHPAPISLTMTLLHQKTAAYVHMMILQEKGLETINVCTHI